MGSAIGSTMEAYKTGTGKVLLAYLPKEELDQYMENVELFPYTPYTITDVNVLRSELNDIRGKENA